MYIVYSLVKHEIAFVKRHVYPLFFFNYFFLEYILIYIALYREVEVESCNIYSI